MLLFIVLLITNNYVHLIIFYNSQNALDWIIQVNGKVVPSCTYASDYIKRKNIEAYNSLVINS